MDQNWEILQIRESKNFPYLIKNRLEVVKFCKSERNCVSRDYPVFYVQKCWKVGKGKTLGYGWLAFFARFSHAHSNFSKKVATRDNAYLSRRVEINLANKSKQMQKLENFSFFSSSKIDVLKWRLHKDREIMSLKWAFLAKLMQFFFITVDDQIVEPNF